MTAATVRPRTSSRTAAFLVPVSALVLPMGLVAALRGSSFDVLFQSVTFHLFVVSGIAACALAVAVVATVAAARSARHHLEPLAGGCLAVGIFMLGHGLTTPGIFGRPSQVWVARLPVLAIAGFAIGLWLVHRRGELRGERRHTTGRLAAAAVVMAIPTAVLVADPTILGQPFDGESAVRDVVAIGAGTLLLHAGLVHWRRWRWSGSSLQFSLTLAAWLSTAALVSLQLGTMWRISWWDYHAFLLAGFGAAVAAILLGRRQTRPVDEALDAAFDADPFSHIVSGYPETLRALVAAVEAKDHYTHGHSARVAELAVRLGIELGLGPEQLRSLARGAYLHDVGKIGIPDAVLNKPGRLEEHERAWIEQHPETGEQMVSQSRALFETLGVIRHHHERYDGGGYPDGLAGDGIPLGARVCAVADVWDALTSDRSYRRAMTHAEAVDVLSSGSGSHFDPAVVGALLRHVGDETPSGSAADGHGEVLTAAATACHEHGDGETVSRPA